MTTVPLTNLNSVLRVIQYNGGPIHGQYGVSSAFQVEPGSPTRPTATRAGTTFDVVLEYTGPSTQSLTLDQLVVISPKFEEVTAMLKAGVIWVHPKDTSFIIDPTTYNTTPEGVDSIPQLDITYSHYFADFHKTKTMPDMPTITSPQISQGFLPKPAAVFDYCDIKGPLTIAVAQQDGTDAAITTGQYIHIKFTETFDDDYNIDFGHFYVIGREVPVTQTATTTTTTTTTTTAPTTAPTTITTDLYTNIVSLPQRQWLLQNGIISTPSTKSPHNVILTPQNHTGFFEGTASVFISSRPIYQYLEYIDGQGDESNLSEEEQELVKTFISFTSAADLFTNTWRQSFASDLITANLQKETGNAMVKGQKKTENSSNNKTLDVPTEMYFFTIDPTTPKQLRNVVLGHLGELQINQNGVDPRQQDVLEDQNSADKIVLDGADIVLSGGKLFTIMACSPSGPTQKFQYSAPKTDSPHKIDGVAPIGVCSHFNTETAKESLSPKILSFVQKALTSTESISPLLPFFVRGAIMSAFLDEYYDQLEKQLNYTPATTPTPVPAPAPKGKGVAAKKTVVVTPKVTKKDPIYTPDQIKWFSKLLTPRILSQTPIDMKELPTHPIYNDVLITSYHGLHHKLHQMATKSDQNGPECFFVMPVDKTTDSHMDTCANLLEFSSILKQFQTPDETNPNKFLHPLELAIFDTLGNNVNDCLYSYQNFHGSARLFISLPTNFTTPQGTVMTTTPGKTTNTSTPANKKQAALDKVAPATKKFTLPMNDVTSLIPQQDDAAPVTFVNNIYAIDIVFEKLIDPSMVEFAISAEEEIPPPTMIELVTYLAKVQGFIRNALHLGSDWSIVPLMSDQSAWAQRFGNQLGKLNGLLDDISYLRLLHSTIVPSIYARFIIQETKTTLEETTELAEKSQEFNIDTIKMVSFAPDSNEDKLFRALRGFTKRAELLLGRLPHPVGLCPIPFLPQPDSTPATLTPFLPQEQINDWDGDESLKIPQLMTLMSGINKTKQLLTGFDQENLTPEQCIDIKEKMYLVRQGTDSTMELINDRVRVIVEIRDCLQQVTKFLDNFPALSIELVKLNSSNKTLQTFFSTFQFTLLNIGLIYTLTQCTLNPAIVKTIEEINAAFKIEPMVIPSNTTPVFYFADAFSPAAPTLNKTQLSKLCPAGTKIPLLHTRLYEAITTAADIFTKSITETVKQQTQDKFAVLAKQNSYVNLEDEGQLDRCLEGFVLLTPQAAPAPAKMSLSRTAITKAATVAAASKDHINNKKFESADDRIIVLWVTHILDGSFPYIDEIKSTLQNTISKYKTESVNGNDKTDQITDQDIVLARVDVDTWPEVLEIFALGEPSALPALLFIQTQAERSDLRSTAIEPRELSQLLRDGLISMIDSPELYGVGGLDQNFDGDTTGTDMEEEIPE